jgi:radical SAM superfamily enzyme YgiQ (UPF0313 family)
MAKVLLVQKTYLEMFGVMSIAAVLKDKGHAVRVSLERGARLAEIARDFAPDVIGVSTVSMNAHANLRDADLLKQALPTVPIVFGGVHPTFFPEIIEQPCVDAVCRGEGEFAFAEFVEERAAARTGAGIANLWVKSNGDVFRNPPREPIHDIDGLPFPDRSVYYDHYPFLKNNPVKNFLLSRGCPFQCSFCFNQPYREVYRECGHTVPQRRRSPLRAIQEIEDFAARWPLDKIAFQDENFCLDKTWLFEFLDLYKSRVNRPFFCMVNAFLADEDIIAALKSAGCYHTTFGLESGDENLRRNVLRKKATDAQIRETSRLLHKHGVTFHTTNIFCFPGETVQSAVRTLRLNAEIRPESAVAFNYMPFANLPLTNEAVKQGWISAEAARDWERLPRVIVRIPNWRRIRRLKLMFGAGVRFPVLIPLIIAASSLPLGPLFAFLSKTMEALDYFTRNRQNIPYMIRNFFQLRRLYKSYFYE